jgi:hypothetical protein
MTTSSEPTVFLLIAKTKEPVYAPLTAGLSVA